jgi:leucyl aminopeptidase
MPMKLVLSSNDPLSIATDVLVLGVTEGDPLKQKPVAKLAKAIGPALGRQLRREEFTGKRDQLHEVATLGKARPERVVLIGLGKSGAVTDADIRVVAAKGARFALGVRASSVAVSIPEVEGGERAAAEGLVLGGYRFTKYLTGERLPKTSLDKGTIVISGKVNNAGRDRVALGQAVAESVCIARDLINEPPNELHPVALADAAVRVCKERGLAVQVFDKKALEKKGAKLILAVAQGSIHEPRLVHMTYKPAAPGKKKKLVFVGKGLTFDTGGICLKPAGGMEEMKGDMGGAANVIALMSAVAATKPDVEVHGIIGCAENMPDGNAYRPGDVFGSLDGKSVEIINTDAEGRLVLADALAYGRSLNPDMMLCNATLTGACVVALGPTVSGFYANRDDLADRMNKACREAGEAMWHMPLVEDLRDGLKSDWADLKHVADRWGGSITAALFLRDFVGDVPWVHIDIAGPSMASKPYNVYAKGGTGHGVLTYLKLIESYAAEA